MIQISDFSSLFELLATINLAFIAVNYLNDYSNILANKVFQIEMFINNSFGEVLSKISELNQKISNLNFQNQNLSNQLNEVTRRGENYIRSLTDKSKETSNEAFQRCYFKNFSSTCLWSFLFCCLVLFISGYESINRIYINAINIHETILFFSLLSYLYFILCWSCSDTKIKFIAKLINKLSYVLIACVVSFVVSIILSLLINLDSICNDYFIYLILLPILTPCVNFIFTICPTFYKINRIKQETTKSINEFYQKEVSVHEKEVDTILQAQEWNLDIVETNNSQFEFDLRGVRHIGSKGLARMELLVANESLKLTAEIDNPFDANAIAIFTQDDIRIGYVPKELTTKFKNENKTLKNTESFTSSINYTSETGYQVKVITLFK